MITSLLKQCLSLLKASDEPKFIYLRLLTLAWLITTVPLLGTHHGSGAQGVAHARTGGYPKPCATTGGGPGRNIVMNMHTLVQRCSKGLFATGVHFL